MIKAVIFDMDGVLIDARDWHYEALNRALQLFGYSISRYDHLVTYDGLPTRQKLHMLTAERGLPKELHQFINEMKQQYTMEITHARCKPVFTHEYCLARLASEGYHIVVASNSIRNTIEVMLGKARLLDYAEFVLSNQDVVKGKPDPEIYVNAIGKLGLDPKECLVIEDNQNGVKAALGSGAMLLKVDSVSEVNYWNIKERISQLDREDANDD